ncbi:DMSO reductase anchor subunit (DmsC) [Tritonibacter multivorans]|uniref:DMSO reductase anchor subunit (DmsC) n=1 Tax=Tritonibacter multivorans TaxID=928856 RepID=A0A0P1GRA7_9RHOB|nr:DmsC/YnfH family molybdoenzyme membrane anchor subunit [Tritonibacter multivorans]MDA7422870.1 dimethyl sulfoxide reductase anchor subunit [Tritonibacter multivorans]CUH78244.1 DMSO reductase anchor subunit (DmsC) [Tritonibacter multivorans]SFD62576.1 DMSO reductase anchor subunit [Tritonibacter multivorans]
MHPAYSVIVFTTSSGAGYGLLFWLSLAHIAGVLPGEGWLPFFSVAVALALITVGLLSSTLHLGHPERAIGAFSQWRSSWLSREGVAAVFTYIPAGLLALIWLMGIETGVTQLLALLSAVGAVVTVYCTGMIYGSLRTIRQWHKGLTPLVYLTLGSATGALLLAVLMAFLGSAPAWVAILVLINMLVAGSLKLSYWRQIDADPGQYTTEMATGLGGNGGSVRPLDPPHTMPNFVMREMGYQVARKHAASLRRLSAIALFAAPIVAVLIATLASGGAAVLYLIATLAAAWGVATERWLFFAEAEHVSQLYYGATRA